MSLSLSSLAFFFRFARLFPQKTRALNAETSSRTLGRRAPYETAYPRLAGGSGAEEQVLVSNGNNGFNIRCVARASSREYNNERNEKACGRGNPHGSICGARERRLFCNRREKKSGNNRPIRSWGTCASRDMPGIADTSNGEEKTKTKEAGRSCPMSARCSFSSQ